MSKRDNLLLVQDMLDSAKKIQDYTEDYSFEQFIDDDKTIDAVVRNFEIIGEAATRIHPDFQIENPQIPWKKLKGYRNRLIHEYFGVDYQIVWDIISDDLKFLVKNLNKITGPNNV
ncbi:DUF86 domain-containing protein [Hyphobacterium sp. CCMP332]|nr:DUF86 domain-containing protein [Hyphobacterium sp. CCMP332]